MEDYLKIYNECLKKEYNNPKLEPLLDALYDLIAYAEEWVMKNAYFICYPNGLEEKREQIMRRYLLLIKKVIRNKKCDEFKNNINLVTSLSFQIDARIIPLYFNLLLFYEDYFDKQLEKNPNFIITEESSCRYIIEMLLINDGNYYQYKDERLLTFVAIALDYLKMYKMESNIYISSIILYCMMNKLDQNKYIEMLDYSFRNYDRLNECMNLYDDYIHMDELYDYMVKKIAMNYDFNSRVIK